MMYQTVDRDETSETARDQHANRLKTCCKLCRSMSTVKNFTRGATGADISYAHSG